jgi:hypothetical protein
MATRPTPAAAEATAAPVTRAKAKAVQASLTQAGLTGFDPAIILAIIQALIAMFSGGICPAPVATRRMRNFGRGQWYLGKNQDERTLDRIIDHSGVLTGEGDNPTTREDVAAAVKDVAGDLAVADVVAMYAENQ